MEYIVHNSLYLPDYLINERVAATEDNVKLLTRFNSLYELQKQIGSNVLSVGDPSQYFCRFCSRNSSQTSFSNFHHFITESISENETQTYLECDDCEESYLQKQDAQLAKYLGCYRALDQVITKNGLVNHETRTSSAKILQDKGGIGIHNVDSENYDATTGVFSVRSERVYRPAMVYQALSRIGYQMLDNDEIPSFRITREWLSITQNMSRFKLPLVIIFSRLKNGNRYRYVTATLYKRKDSHLMEPIPEKVLIVHAAKYQFQIFLPYAGSDIVKDYKGGNNEQYGIPMLPASLADNYTLEIIKDMSSFDLIHEVQNFDLVPNPGMKPIISRPLP